MATGGNPLEPLLAQYRNLQKEVAKLQSGAGQANTQIMENDMVLKELELLEEDAQVFKLIGPVLVKQELVEVKTNVSKRIEFIKNDIGRSARPPPTPLCCSLRPAPCAGPHSPPRRSPPRRARAPSPHAAQAGEQRQGQGEGAGGGAADDWEDAKVGRGAGGRVDPRVLLSARLRLLFCHTYVRCHSL